MDYGYIHLLRGVTLTGTNDTERYVTPVTHVLYHLHVDTL